MQPKLEKVPYNLTSSIYVKREIVPYMDYPWHYHPEFEIIFVEKSYGIRLMGSHTGNFHDGDLVFISPNLPHVWRNDKDFYKGDEKLFVDVYVIQFREDALGLRFFDHPEFDHVRKLFLRGQQGILILGKDKRKISEMIKSAYNSTGIERLSVFLKTLDAIANSKNYKLLSQLGYIDSVNKNDTTRLNTVMNYIMTNYRHNINLEEVANLINLNKSSFCRYFKSRTRKTCSQFLNEIRIAHACKLLLNSDLSVSEICYDVGYNNISHFNRQFKRITGFTAREYSKHYFICDTVDYK